jgi:hypothetical protein
MNKFRDLCAGLRLKVFAVIAVAALFAMGASFWATPAQAIIVCHDYSLYRVTGIDPNPSSSTNPQTGVGGLRSKLTELGFELFRITNSAAQDPEETARHLKPGDVLVLRDDHSGYVNESGTIDHFVQLSNLDKITPIVRHDASALPKHPFPGWKYGGLFLGDTLRDFLEKPFLSILNPGLTKRLEVWRRTKQAGDSTMGSREIKHGPFSATPQGWKSTGLRLRKGQSFRLEASGKLTGQNKENLGPFDGVGNWRWRILSGKLGNKAQEFGGNGWKTAWEDGVLELGVPQVVQDFRETGYYSGAFTVYIYVNANESNTVISGSTDTSGNNNKGGAGQNENQSENNTKIGAKLGAELERILKGGSGAALGASNLSVEYDTDRPGGDYRNYDLPRADVELCRNACAGDANCKAYTYVKPGVQGSSARCWLKSSIPPAGKSSCCISGTKP